MEHVYFNILKRHFVQWISVNTFFIQQTHEEQIQGMQEWYQNVFNIGLPQGIQELDALVKLHEILTDGVCNCIHGRSIRCTFKCMADGEVRNCKNFCTEAEGQFCMVHGIVGRDHGVVNTDDGVLSLKYIKNHYKYDPEYDFENFLELCFDGQWLVLVEWFNGEKTWEPIKVMIEDCKETLMEFVETYQDGVMVKNLLDYLVREGVIEDDSEDDSEDDEYSEDDSEDDEYSEDDSEYDEYSEDGSEDDE